MIDKGVMKMSLRVRDFKLDTPNEASCRATTQADYSLGGGAMKLLSLVIHSLEPCGDGTKPSHYLAGLYYILPSMNLPSDS